MCRELPAAMDQFDPDIVVYNAGTDILKGDPLGNLDITPDVRIHDITCNTPSPGHMRAGHPRLVT